MSRILQQQLAEAKATMEAKVKETQALRESIQEIDTEFQRSNRQAREKQDVRSRCFFCFLFPVPWPWHLYSMCLTRCSPRSCLAHLCRVGTGARVACCQ